MQLVSKVAPFFKGMAFAPLTKNFQEITLKQYAGKYLLLFFYPSDFTFVCPTEIKQLNSLKQQFESKGCDIVCCSTDSVHSHYMWNEITKEQGGFNNTLELMMLSDQSHQISKDYGVLLEGKGFSLWGTFLINPNQVVVHQSTNDLPVGRNIEEILRLLDAFQFTDKNGEVCPSQWKSSGDPTLQKSHFSNKTQDFFKTNL